MIPHLALERGEDETVVGVLGGGLDEFHGGGAGLHDCTAQQRERLLAVERDGDLQNAFFFTAIDGEHLMPLQAGDRLRKIVV